MNHRIHREGCIFIWSKIFFDLRQLQTIVHFLYFFVIFYVYEIGTQTKNRRRHDKSAFSPFNTGSCDILCRSQPDCNQDGYG